MTKEITNPFALELTGQAITSCNSNISIPIRDKKGWIGQAPACNRGQ